MGSHLEKGLLSFWMVVLPLIAQGGPVYPLKASVTGRYLVDHSNAPVMIVGDSPQALMVNLTTNEAAAFFADRAGYGYNTMWINLLCGLYTGGRADASTIDGILPFTTNLPSTTSYDLTAPNEAYFARVDQMLALAAQNGIQVLLDPCETGAFLLQGSLMRDNGTNRCRAYGQFLGARYKNVPNIIWMSGNDFQTWSNPDDDAVVRAVALGIKDQDTNHLQTTELNYLVSSSLDDANWTGIITLNAAYTYFPTYARLWQDYNRTNFLPTFLVEANYEFENLQGPVTTPPILRKQEYWSMTSGACGQMYGNGFTWPFRAGWQDNLDTVGAAQIKIMKQFFEARAWYNLLPDTNHAVVTSNYGVYSDSSHVADNDFLTAARASDGSVVVIYTPIIRQFRVDFSQLSGPAVTRWFDPSSGAFTTISGSPFANSGSGDFTPPGSNADGDGGWVLVLETNPPPDLSPPPPPPRPKFVQQNYVTPQSPQIQVSASYASAQVAGNANILAVGWNDEMSSLTNVSDSAGNSYQVAIPAYHGAGMSQAIYFAPRIKAGANTVTVRFDQPANFVDLRITEYSNLAPTNFLAAAISSSGTGATAATGALALLATNQLLFAAGMTATSFSGPGPGFTQRAITTPDGDLVEDQIAASLGPFNATAPLASGQWLMQFAVFRPAPLIPPGLRIILTTTNTTVLAWDATAANFSLQENGNLATTNWTKATNSIALTNGENQVILLPGPGQRFFRLKAE